MDNDVGIETLDLGQIEQSMKAKNFPVSEYFALLKLTDGCKRRVYYSEKREPSKFYLYLLLGVVIYYDALVGLGGEIFESGNILKSLLILLFPLLLFMVLLLTTYNMRKLIYVLGYKSSVWYKNTAYMPSQVVADKGIYGEFIATYYVRNCYRKHDLKVRIYNSLAIPKRYISDKLIDFSEIDIVAVSDIGVEVFEIKNRAGIFSGASGAETWTQRIGSQTHEMENPLLQNDRHCKALRNWALENASEDLEFQSIVNVVLFVGDAEFEISGTPVYESGKDEPDPWFGNLAHYDRHELKRETLDPKWVSESKLQLMKMLDELPKYGPSEMDDLMNQRRRHYESQ